MPTPRKAWGNAMTGTSGARLAAQENDLPSRSNQAPGGLDVTIDWRALVDRMHEGFLVAEAIVEDGEAVDFRHIFLNAAWGDMTGLDPADILGRPTREALPELEPQWRIDFARVGASQEPATFTRRVDFLDLWFDIHAFPMGGVRFGVLFLEVSERMRARALLEEKASALSSTLSAAAELRQRNWEISPDLLGVVDGEARFIETNPAWQDVLGHSRETMATTPLFEFIHPDDLASTGEVYESLQRGEPLPRYVNRYRHADGSYRWISWVAVPQGDRIHCIGRDVTADQERQIELAERTAERDRVWRASQDLYVTIGPDGRYRAANPAWESELGHPPADLIGTRFDVLAHPDDRTITEQRWHDVLNGLFLTDHEIRVQAKDGTYRWFSFTVFADDDMVVAVGRDVEERRAREAELEAAEEALRQSQKLEMIGQLTGGVAHDFNNLLMAVQTSLGLLAKRLPKDDMRAARLIDNAEAGVRRGAALTQRMLAFARRQDLAPGPVDIADLLLDMRDLMARSLGPAIRITTRFDWDVPPALVDANQLEMAVLNLAVNARDAMEEGGELTVSLSRESVAKGGRVPAGDYVRLAVADDGTGMDAETLSRAAEPFFTTKGIGKGTGLGLSMIHGLAEQSGGTFTLTSEPGRGTTAELLLPATSAKARVGVRATGDEAAAAKSERNIDGDAGSLKILVVDDDPLVLMGTVGMLEDLGHDVVQALSGQAALERLGEHEDIDLLLTDQAMPKMTGLQLAEAARAERAGLPVILATGYAEIPSGGEALVDLRLGKPFQAGDIQEAIVAVGAGRRGARGDTERGAIRGA